MYSPKIKENQVKELFKLKEKIKIPMTKLVEEAIGDLLKKYEKKTPSNLKGRSTPSE
jgi:3-methyladenine DNA glycosylase AlkD